MVNLGNAWHLPGNPEPLGSAGMRDPGVVEAPVDASEPARCPPNKRLDGVRLRHVGDLDHEVPWPAVQVGGDALERPTSSADGDDRRTAGAGAARQRLPNPAAGPGHNDDLVLKPDGHPPAVRVTS